MGYFRKEKFTTSDTKEKFWIFNPTVKKKGKNVVFIKNKHSVFVKKRRK